MPRRKVDPVALANAVEKIKTGEWTMRLAAKLSGIPRSTLHDRCSGKHAKVYGSSRVFTDAEEAEYVFFIKECERLKIPLTLKMFMVEVVKVLKGNGHSARFKGGIPGDVWKAEFFKRHNTIVPRVSSSVTIGMALVSEYDIRRWHSVAKLEIEAFEGASDIFSDPRRIFNGDETAFSLDGSK
jgi:hypothetical protein